MIVIDVETTGTNPHKHSIVSIGAVDFYKPSEQFLEECKIWEGAHVEHEALVINGYSEQEISDPKKKSEAELVSSFFTWLEARESLLPAGHNPLFDLGFLQAAAERSHQNYILPSRSLDLHSVCFAHMIKKNVPPPMVHKKSALNSDAVMLYVGIPAEPKPHIALNGAIWEAEAFSRLLYGKTLLPQFSKDPILCL